jgi:hypothetical protein
MEIDSVINGPGDLFYEVNDDVPTAVKIGGESVNFPSSTIIPVKLVAGYNSIQFGNPTGVAPDLDRIAIIGEGNAISPPFAVYDAEIGKLSGTALNNPCELCSGNTKIVGLGGGNDNLIIFPDVKVAVGGMYQMEIDYLTQLPRVLDVTINDAKPIQLNLTGDGEGSPSNVVIPVFLKFGNNTIRFGNPDGDGPALDKIAIALPSRSTTLALGIRKQSGPSNHRIWTLDLANLSKVPAQGAQLNLLTLVQVAGQGACQPKVLASLPISVGTISKEKDLTLDVPIDFSDCSSDALFNATIVYSSDRGAVVGDIIGRGLFQ